MNKMKHYITLALITALAFTSCVPAVAQGRKDYNLERDYGLTAMQAKLSLKHIPTPDQKAPKLYERMRGLGWSDARIGEMNLGPAYHNEAVLQGQGGNQPITGRITSNNGVAWPNGDFDVNYPCITDGGEYIGQGTGYAGNNPPTTSSKSMNTTLRLNRAGWLGTEFDQMNLIQTSTWGMLTGSNSYTESGLISGFLLIGDNGGWHDPSYMSSGLGAWDLGETYRVDDIYARDFNGCGITLVRGTPASIGTISAFTNSVGGIGIIGGALNTYAFQVVSGDDNPAMFHVRPGYGREGGGAINVALVKSESGKRTPNKGQIVMDAIGYTRATFGSVWVAVDYEKIDALFVMENRGSGSSVTVQNLDGYGYATVVQDITNRKRWASPGDYVPCSFRWESRNSGTMTALGGTTLTAGTHSCTTRLGRSVYANGAWTPYNYTACTPAYTQGTAPPPPTCTWVTGTQTCAPCNGTAVVCTTPYVSSAAGCTPTTAKPADVVASTPCTVTPPPSGNVLATFNDFSNTSATASTVVNWKGVKRVKFEQVTVSTKGSTRLMYGVNDNNGLRLHDDGRWRAPNGQVCQSTPAVWVIGQTYTNAEIVVPVAFDAAFWLAKPPAGSALLFSAKKVEVLNQ